MQHYDQSASPDQAFFVNDELPMRSTRLPEMVDSRIPATEREDDPITRHPRNPNKYQAKLPSPAPSEPAPPSSTSQNDPEPPRPTPRWSRRCLTPHRIQRSPDVHEAIQMDSDEQIERLRKEWQQQLQQDCHHCVQDYIVDCVNCNVALQVRKACVMILCPACRKVIPSASCPAHAVKSTD